MSAEMTINLPIEKAHQHLLRYFETREDINVRSSEPKSIQVRTSGWKHPWINIEIGMFGEENSTKLAFNFSFRLVYTILAIILVMGIAFIWVLPQSTISSIILTAIIGTCALIAWASDISKAKRKFLDDIRKAFETD